ncbi:MAG: LIC12162 family protein [Bacteroidetes bacterium]|nr:LIC12162 family protein [Bacteroidota bacterium]
MNQFFDYHWNNRVKLKRDFEYLQSLNELIMEELVELLNHIHGKRRNKKYWRLLVGYWLNIYTAVLYDRWFSLLKLTVEQKKLIINSNSLEMAEFATNNTEDFIAKASESSSWNDSLFALLAKRFFINDIELVDINSTFRSDIPKNYSEIVDKNRYLKKLVRIIVSQIKKRDRFFFYQTYLSHKSLIELELKLSQCPFPNLVFSEVITSRFDPGMRSWKIPLASAHDQFSKLARELLPYFIPRSYLEGFQDLNKVAQSMPWPKEPKAIFTSISHFTDEIFKFWTAEKLENGTRLIIGEHGGMGVGLFNGCHAYELTIADSYLSSGWVDIKKNSIIPIGNLRTFGKKVFPNEDGNALLVCTSMPRYSFDIRSMPISGQIVEYFEDQIKFLEALPIKLKDQITVRLYPVDYGWKTREQFLERHPQIRFDNLKESMFDSAKRHRLFIGTYAATTYLDMLSLNFPTVVFWNPHFWEIKDEAKHVFSTLKKAGIFHDTPESAALQVAHIWDKIPEWWNSLTVQNARQLFCSTYSTLPSDMLKKIENIILQK